MMKCLGLMMFLFVTSCHASNTEQSVKSEKEYSLEVTKKGALSVLAIDLSSKEIVVEHNAVQRMIPASLTKIFTSAAVICTLPSDFRFKTQFYLVKDVDGKLSILVVGGGDPTLGSNRFKETKSNALFDKIAEELVSLEGVRNLDGGIIIDNSCYSGVKQPSKRVWEDIGNYYGAVPNGLTFRENTFQLTLRSPNVIGSRCHVVNTDPQVDIEFDCLVTSANNDKDSAYIYGNAYMDKWYVSGTIPMGRKEFSIKGALPNPDETFAKELKLFLQAKGIGISNKIQWNQFADVSGEKRIVLEHSSPSICEIIAVVNKRSQNLYADHLLFALAENEFGVANWDNGVKSLVSFWQKRIDNFSGLFFDGSGLSPFNAVSAQDMVEALIWVDQSKVSNTFKQSLSVAGVDGTLKSILKEDEYRGAFIGKSGSMNGVLGYCGYIKTKGGRELAFCIMANKFTEPFKDLRANMEVLMQELISMN